MTEQQAIDVLNMIETHGSLPTDAKALAIKALEKQIPIAPSEVNDEALKLCGIFDWCCGKCGTHHRNDFLLNYCSECGQALKWE